MMLKIQNFALSNLFSAFAGARTFYIFSGPMPTVDSAFAFNPADYADQQLGTVNAALTYGFDASLYFAKPSNGIVPTFTPTKSGTATWFAVVFASNENSRAFLGTITNVPANKDPLLLSAIDLVLGTPVSFIDFNFKLGYV